MRSNGKTFRKALKALADASYGNTVFFISDTIQHLKYAKRMIFHFCKAIDYKRTISYNKDSDSLKFNIINSDQIFFYTLDTYDKSYKKGYYNPKEYYDIY